MEYLKYAAKPQKLNPNKPSHVDDWAIWEKIVTAAPANTLEQQGWFVSDSDNFVEWFQLKKNCPSHISPRQARQALALQGISEENILNGFNSLPSPIKELAKIEWDYSLEIKRDRLLVNSVAKLLGWSQYDLDRLFVFAKNL